MEVKVDQNQKMNLAYPQKMRDDTKNHYLILLEEDTKI
jgi:hypothetical protein